jgi:hypothetical protein
MMRIAVALVCVSVAGFAADFEVSQGVAAGYAHWSGWTGRSVGVFVEPAASYGSWGVGLNLSVTTDKVSRRGASESFWPVGALLKARYSVLEAGLGYGYIPGFTSRDGRVTGGAPSFAWTVGASFPVVSWDRYYLKMGLHNTALTALDRFVNPALVLTLTYRPRTGGR